MEKEFKHSKEYLDYCIDLLYHNAWVELSQRSDFRLFEKTGQYVFSSGSYIRRLPFEELMFIRHGAIEVSRKKENVIPPMTHPYGKVWDAPDRSEILVMIYLLL